MRRLVVRAVTGVGAAGGTTALAVLLLASPASATSVSSVMVSMPAGSNVAGGFTTYTIAFTTTQPVPALGSSCPCSITVTAPNGTGFSGTTSNYNVAASTGTAAISSVAVSKVPGPGGSGTSATDNQVVITLSSSTIGALDNVTVTAAGTTNPTLASTTYVTDVSDSSDTTPTASSPYIITNAPASQLAVVSGNNQTTPAGSAFGSALVVALEDPFGNPVATSGVSVKFLPVPASNGASCTFSGGTPLIVTTGVNGQATTTTPPTANSTAGPTYTVTASSTGLSSASFTLANTGSPSTYVFVTPPFTGPASSSADNGPITIQEQDSFGNPVKNVAAVGLASTSGTGVFSATNGGTPTTNVAIGGSSSTVSFWYGDTAAGSPMITVSSGSGANTITGTQTETITAANASKLVFTTTAMTGSASSTANLGTFTVQEQDAFNNPTTTAETVNLSSNTTGTPVFSATQNGTAITSVAIPSGQSTASFYYGDTKAGTPTITAAATGLTSAMQTETINPATASQLFFTSSPQSGAASNTANLGPLNLVERDQFGNVSTTALTVNLSSNTAGTAVFSATQNGTPETSLSISSGSSTASFFYGDTKAGTPTVTAAATGITSATQMETIIHASASQLGVASGNNQSTPAGSSFGAPLAVQIEDSFGNPVPTSGTGVTFTAPSLTMPSATFSNTTNTETDATNSSGVATSSTPTANSIAGGSYHVNATATGLSGTFFTLANTGAPAKLVFTSSPMSGPASATANQGPFTVQEQDSFNNPTTSAATVNLSSNSTGTAVFSATQNGSAITSVAIPSGQSTATFWYGDTKAGTPTITAAATGLTSGTQMETVTAASPAQFAFTTAPFTGPASSTANNGPITVQEQDAFGNPTTSAETVNLSSNSTGTAVFSATHNGTAVTSVNITSGSSSASFFYGDTMAGTPTITADPGGLTAATQLETITAASPSKLVFTNAAVSGPASSTAFLGPFTVQEEDAFNNPTTAAETVNLSSNSAGTTVFSTTQNGSAVTSVAISSGSSTATFWYGDTKAGTPTITAAATGLTSATQMETVQPNAPASLTFTTEPGNGTAGSALTTQPVVTIKDTFGNVVSSGSDATDSIQLMLSSAMFSTGSPTATIHAVNGVATFSGLQVDVAGTYTMTASDQSFIVPSATSSPFTVSPSAPAELVFVTAPVSGPTSNSANLGPITVAEEDAYGNRTTAAATVNLSTDSSTGVFSATQNGSPVSSVDIASGQSSASFFYGDSSRGTPTLTVQASGLAFDLQSESIGLTGLPTVAVEGPNNSLWVYWQTADAQWNGPLGVGQPGSTFSSPSMAIGANGFPIVAVQGPGNRLWVYWQTPDAQWNGPLGIGDTGSTFSAPTVVIGANGLPTIAVQGPGNRLWVYWQTPDAQWHGPLGIGDTGSTFSTPSMVIGDNGLPTISVEGPGNRLWVYWQTPDAQWHGPLGVGDVGSTFSAPSMVVGNSGLPTITVQGPGNRLWVFWQTPDAQWHGPLGVGDVGSAFSDPSMDVNPDGLPTITVQGPGNRLWVFWQTPDAQWNGPLGIGGAGSTFSDPSIAFDD